MRKWAKGADEMIMAPTPKPRPRLTGAFEIGITWPSSTFTRSDIDDRVMPLLDYLQRIEMISNDRFCCRSVTEFARRRRGAESRSPQGRMWNVPMPRIRPRPPRIDDKSVLQMRDDIAAAMRDVSRRRVSSSMSG